MTTVNIDIAKLKSAITALTGLAEAIDGQRARAMSGTPIGLPSLTDGELGKKSRWLRDQEPELQVRHDLAVLLDSGDTGHASYDVALDTLDMAKDMLGNELAEALNDVDYKTSEEDLDKLNEIIAGQQDDPDVMSAMFKKLGPDGTVGVLGNITSIMGSSAVDAEKLRDLAEHMRTGLATASNSDSWQNRPDPYGSSLTYAQMFADDMVRYSTAPMLTDEEQDAFQEKYPNAQGMYGASILTFLMQEKGYSDDFLLSAASTLDTFEQQMHDGDMEATYWYSHNGYSPLVEKDELTYDDPMAAIMQNLAANPTVGLDFFTQGTDRQKFYFNDRDWSDDGYESIAMAADKISTDLDNLKADPKATTLLASAFVDYVADSEGFNPDDAKAASPYIADLLKFYMPSVANTLDGSAPDGDPKTIADVTILGLGKFDYLPEFYLNDLTSLTGVAMSTSSGMETMAEGVGGYTTSVMNGVAADLAADPDNIDLRTQLQNVLMNDAELRGFTTQIAGATEIQGAEDAAARQKAWASLLGEVADIAPVPFSKQAGEAVGEWSTKLVDYGWGKAVELGQGSAEDALGWASGDKSPKEAYDDATAQAEAGLSQMNIEAYRSLVNAGVIAEDKVPDKWYGDDGQLLTYDEILKAGDVTSFNQSATTGMSSYIPDENLENTYKDSFQEYYEKPKDE